MRFIDPSCARRASDEQFGDLAGAVAKLVDGHADFVEQRHVQVREGRSLGIYEVPASANRARTPADDNCRQRAVCVPIAVAETRSEEKDNAVEERAVAFL